MLKKFFVVIFCLWFLTGSVYGSEDLGEKEKNTANPAQTVSIRERDPFSLSSKLLSKTISEKYVSFTGEGLTGFNLPRIEITGVMVVGDKTMATAKIESLGEVTLKPSEKIIVKMGNPRKNAFISFFVKEITPSELIIILEGGQEVHGRFR